MFGGSKQAGGSLGTGKRYRNRGRQVMMRTMQKYVRWVWEKSDMVCMAALLVTPVVIIPQVQSGIEVGRMWWVWVVVEVWWGVRMARGRWPRLGVRGLGPIAGWLVVTGLTSWTLGGWAVWGGYWRQQGWWSWVHFGLAWYLVATAQIRWREVEKIMAGVAAVAVAIGVTQVNGQRAVGTLGEANNLGLMAAVLAATWKGRGKWLMRTLGGVGMVISQSRAVIVALLGAIFYDRSGLGKKWFLIGLIVLGWWTFVRSDGGRLLVWGETMEVWRSSPWIGIGWDNLQSRFAGDKRLIRYDNPHNVVLWSLVSQGAIGTALMVGWGYVVWVGANKEAKKIAVLVLVFTLFQPVSSTVFGYLAVILGMMANDQKVPLAAS